MFSACSRRLLGWLSYAFASEAFAVVSLSLFLPVCLEQFARDNGFLEPDRTTRCVGIAGGGTATSGASCSVRIGRAWIGTTSFSLYINSIALAVQALTVISMGGIADRATGRKPLLFTFAFTGATAAICFIFLPSSSPVWILCALFSICATVSFGASVVAMNAYLPSLACDSSEVLEAKGDLDVTSRPLFQPLVIIREPDRSQVLSPGSDSISTFLSRSPPPPGQNSDSSSERKAYVRALSQATSRISSRGIASGYLAGILVLILILIPILRLHSSTFSLRLAIGLSGAWWMLFSIPAAIWLPGPSACTIVMEGTWNVSSEIWAAWKRLGVMLRWSEMKRLQHTFRFLLAWFILADGIQTITSTAILFAKTMLHMKSASLVVIGAITPAAGIVGAFACPFLQRRFGWSNPNILLCVVLVISLIPVYGTLGFVPYFEEKRAGGLQTPAEMFVVAVYFGFAFGVVQSYARATFAALIPPGEEARWYGLFSITDKSGSFIGPLIVGLIAGNTGNIRYSFFYLVGMIWLAVLVLLSVDVERGRADAKMYSEEQARVVQVAT